MTPELPLAEQRRRLREEMAQQRSRLALRLGTVGRTPGRYPRSHTVRWLMSEPELIAGLVSRVAGKRAARAMPAVLLLARFLRSSLSRP